MWDCWTDLQYPLGNFLVLVLFLVLFLELKDFCMLALGASQRFMQVSKLTELPNWTHIILYKLDLSEGYLKVQLQATIW